MKNLAPAAVRDVEPFEPGARRGGRILRTQAVQSPEIIDLLPDPHAGVQPALFRHVPNRRRSDCPTRDPFHRTVPALRSVRPKMARMVVVFPAPFGPRKPTTRPDVTVNDKLSSAVMVPNVRRNPSISS
jgi:hypothetical protein